MENDGEDFMVRAEADSVFLLLSGEPIDEPIAAYGPFVMSTQGGDPSGCRGLQQRQVRVAGL